MKLKIILFCLFFFSTNSMVMADVCDDVWIGPNVNTEALNNCKILAEQGSSGAQLEYGLLLLRLPEKYKNLSEGIHWIRKSAQSGNEYAQVGLATFLSNEKFEKNLINYPEAYAWFAVLNDNVSMKVLSTKMNKQELELSKKFAQEYVQKYRQIK